MRALVVLVVVMLGTLSACSKEKTPGQVVIAIDTDMALPDQIDTIEIEVTAGDTTLLDYFMPVGTGTDAQPIPATLTLVAGDDDKPATVRVIGSRNGVARTLRQAVTTIPSDRLVTLRMPLQWLCDGTAMPAPAGDAGSGYESTCGPGESCQAGSCVAAQVDSETLPAYQPQSIFGGGSQPSGKGTSTGTCFDTIACLVGATLEAPDDQCTVSMPSGGSGVNVGLRVANDGICDTTGTTCFVPLDGNSTEGWTTQAGRIALPPAVCTKLQAGLIAGVAVSTTCATKTNADPPCGAWSSVTPPADAGGMSGRDAAASTTPTLVASASADGGAGVACCPLMADGSKLYTCLCNGASPPQIVSIDPSTGVTTTIGHFTPQKQRAQYAAVVGGSDLYWADRTITDAGYSCPVNATSTTDGTTGSPVAVADADVYLDGTVLLADAANLYALADNVAGLPATAAPVQLLRIARGTGVITPVDTGGAGPVFQFTQDASAVYVAVDTDQAIDGGLERISRVVRLPKNGDPSTPVQQSTLATTDPHHGGTIGLQDDGTTLFELYEAAPAADGTVDTQVLMLSGTGSAPNVLYDEVLDPSVAQLRLLGAVDGAVLLVRDITPRADAGASSSESSILVIPASGGAPRIVASFLRDTPIFEIQAPTFTGDVFWLNQGGRVFRLPAAALR